MQEGGLGRRLAGQLARPVGVVGTRPVVRSVAAAVGPAPVEYLVGGDEHEVGPGANAGLGELGDGHRVPAHGALRLARAAVDVRPRGRVDHDLRRHLPDAAGRRLRVVDVVGRAAPGQRAERTGERRVAEGAHEGATEPAPGPGDGDAHQASPSAGVPPRAGSASAVEPARRSAYWRS